MNYLNKQQFDLGAECQEDATVSTAVLTRKTELIEQQKLELGATEEAQRMLLNQELAVIQIDLDQGELAWNNAFPAFKMHLEKHQWEQAAAVCDTLFRSNQPDSLVALGHGLWLSITFPVDPTLTVAQLQHVINETPEDSDGAAVAAAVAAYIVDLRGDDNASDDATLAVGQMLNEVARRHGNAHNQEEFDQWFRRLELDQPNKLLVRMRNIIDVLVQDQWWIDRDSLQQLIPEVD
ncbi:MAG: hypothetical protein ACR2QW_02520 [bacterium]